jgi:hypothetical protein
MTMLSVRPSLGENTLRRLVLTNAKSAKSTALGGEGLVMGQSGDLIGQVVDKPAPRVSVKKVGEDCGRKAGALTEYVLGTDARQRLRARRVGRDGFLLLRGDHPCRAR